MNIILASSSKYRRNQLNKLQLRFSCISPNIDESPLNEEKPDTLAMRLAQNKAYSIAKQNKSALVIGSDQVAYANQKIIGKPGSKVKAIEQLTSFSDKTVIFYTAICVIYGDQQISDIVSTECKFLPLSNTQIKKYLDIDQALDTAGSAKIEQAGIALMEYVRSDDPSALIGLPLIALCRILRKFGVDPLN